ncbi:glycosyltransferase, partial [archaeon]|nr:glycosyltransferase [archaeon]
KKIPLFLYPQRNKGIFSTGLFGYDFTKTKEFSEADIIHLHWINDCFVNLKTLNKINKPIIWTMRDMWPITGGCHYSASCDHYKNGCGHCPKLASNTKTDLSRFVLSRKKLLFPKEMTLVAMSSWLLDCAKESTLFKDYDTRHIPNNINSDFFFSVDKKTARKILEIKTKKTILLSGATHVNEVDKGFFEYLEALKTLDRDKFFLCFFGNLDTGLIDQLGFEYKSFGYLFDHISLSMVYSVADIFVAPSLYEAFGKTIVESMTCKTPVVCFDATGPKDIVSHKINGYKAIPYDSKDLAMGIEWIANHLNYSDLCEAARKKAIEKYDSKVIASQYLALYNEILNK